MRITTKGRYALSAVVALACLADDDDPISVRSLALNEGLSADFLEQIFFRLRRSGIVSSVRGPGGGFRLARPSCEISLREILSAAGEDMEMGDPLLPENEPCYRAKVLDRGLARKGSEADRRDSLGIGNRKAEAALRELEEKLKGYAQGKTLADIVDA